MLPPKEVHLSWKTSSNIGNNKSFVYDLNKELGIVRMRVAFVPRSTEIKPLFWRFVLTTLQLIHRVRKRGAWFFGAVGWGEISLCVDSALGGWGGGLAVWQGPHKQLNILSPFA